MDLTSDYFALFGLPVDYSIDLSALGERYRDLQRNFHPDRYAHKNEREQRVAVQYAAMINEAYETLKSPLLRARYLLHLNGRQDTSETTTIRDHEFLLQQIELRETIGEIEGAADPHLALNDVENEIGKLLGEQQQLFQQAYSVNDFDTAEQNADKIQFFSNLLLQLETLEETLDD